ncbi:MAG: hypothetical protein K5882_05220 [Bacteroidales bacterium]|nr:hypothetical protein [Bacteroidales bacterium]
MKYTVKNFKIFDEKGVTFDIAPITMLTGCNSSGKSSLVKSMTVLYLPWLKILDGVKKEDV